jgi:aminoglycoside phosphotransferase (APT) family kinase protein
MKSPAHGTVTISADTDDLPSDATLAASLARMLGASVDLVSRERNAFSGASTSEIVGLRTDDDELKVFVKYGRMNRRHTGHGYWGDVAYEAAVYRDVLEPLGAGVPRLIGFESLGTSSWLVMQYADGERLSKSPRDALISAGRWLGEFHRAAEKFLDGRTVSSINVLDARYFRSWSQRTRAFTRSSDASKPWIESVCAAFEELAPSLVSETLTVVHGEFYPANVLVARGRVLPVDWQSAAVGPGEIDVASLIEGWGDGAIVAECLRTYERSRWPHGTPESFRQRLNLARVYWPLRWLGDDPAWSLNPKRARYFDELKEAARRAGLSDGEEVA